MYLLPVTTYFDYLRASRNWTLLTGGTLLVSILLKYPSLKHDTLNKGQAEVKIKLGDLTRVVQSTQQDPYAILQQAGVGVGPNDVIRVEGNEVSVLRVEQTMFVEDSEVPFSTEKKVDSKLPPQTQKVIEGTPGKVRKIIKRIVAGDQEIGAEVVSTEIVKQPVNKVILINPAPVISSRQQKKTPILSRSLPKNTQFKRVLTVESTAYTFTGNNTATGRPPRTGIVAVDPRVIPLGTKLYIEGYGMAVAGDTGGAIKGNRIDVFMNTVKECLSWGRRKVKVYILAS